MTKIFIDGQAGTTGLRLQERLSSRNDLTLLSIPEQFRKDPVAKAEIMNQADVVFLCLPDDAARESAGLVAENITVIDTSTAHRTSEDWTYGFPELTGQREKIQVAKRIANPGCHASGAIAILAPLVENHVLSPDADLSIFSLTGYSGGGKKMIAQYEEPSRDVLLDAPRTYGLSQAHKHLPEIVKYSHLAKAPVFAPIVAPYYAGMEVMVPLHSDMLSTSPEKLSELYQDYYQSGLVSFAENNDENGFMSAGLLAGRDNMVLTISGNDERLIVTARFDNLGKGASGAAIQNMNLAIGANEDAGLNL